MTIVQNLKAMKKVRLWIPSRCLRQKEEEIHGEACKTCLRKKKEANVLDENEYDEKQYSD